MGPSMSGSPARTRSPSCTLMCGAARELVLALLAVVAGHEDLAVLLGHVAVLHDAVDLGDDRRLLGPPRLEQLDHARQTARDVLGLGGLARGILASTSPGVTSLPSSTIRWAPEGSRYLRGGLALLVLDLDARLLLLVGRLHDDERRHAGVLVHLLVHGLAVDDVLEGDGWPPSSVRMVNEYGIPLDQQLALLDLRAVLDLELGAVDHGVALALAALLVVDDERARAVHDHQVALLVLDRGHVVELARCRRSWPRASSARCGGWRCRRCGTCAW